MITDNNTEMDLIKSIKSCMRHILQKRGYDICKVYRKNIRNGKQYMNIGNISLAMPLDHDLPNILYLHPLYSHNLPDIASFMVKKYTTLGIVDVGANIGDTVALILNKVKDNISFLCIEGNNEYIPYLIDNLSGIYNVEIVDSYLSDTNAKSTVEVITEYGSAHVKEGVRLSEIEFTTLDSIMNDHQQDAMRYKLLKIDTDGFDFKIIRGGLKYIEKVRPVIFFEYDRDFLNEQNDYGFEIFDSLFDIGYEKLLVYDCLGNFLLPIEKNNFNTVFCYLDRYIKGKHNAIMYFDICLFHDMDSDLFDEILDYEINKC